MWFVVIAGCADPRSWWGLRAAAPAIVCDGQPMIRERAGDGAAAMEDDDADYVYDLYTAVGEDTEDENGASLPTVRCVPPVP